MSVAALVETHRRNQSINQSVITHGFV